MPGMGRWDRCIVLMTVVAACGDDQGTDPDYDATDGTCLLEPVADATAFRYQYEGSLVLEAVVEGPFDGVVNE